jgi:hypothetical protein
MPRFTEDVEIVGGSLILKDLVLAPDSFLAPLTPAGEKVRVRIKTKGDTVTIFDSDENQALRFNSTFAILDVGGEAKDHSISGRSAGDIRVYDGAGRARVHIAGQSGGIRVQDTSGQDRIQIEGQSGRIRVRDTAGKKRIDISGEDGAIQVLKNSAIKVRDTALAVEFEVEDPIPSPGTVMMLVEGEEGEEAKVKARAGRFADDHSVVGVLMETPRGIVLDHNGSSSENRRPIAVAGKVDCRVFDSTHDIAVGDVLVASNDVPGHAEKMNFNVVGAILGKALEAVPAGTSGTIRILLTL